MDTTTLLPGTGRWHAQRVGGGQRLDATCAATPLHRVSRGPPPRVGEEYIIVRARECVGARFRMQGRDPANGLDCVGLAAVAFGIAAPVATYSLRGGDANAFGAMITRAGLRPLDGTDAGGGDLLMVRAGPGQLHLVVLTDAGFVHADARLRRVVEMPGGVPWPVLMAWRQPKD